MNSRWWVELVVPVVQFPKFLACINRPRFVVRTMGFDPTPSKEGFGVSFNLGKDKTVAGADRKVLIRALKPLGISVGPAFRVGHDLLHSEKDGLVLAPKSPVFKA